MVIMAVRRATTIVLLARLLLVARHDGVDSFLFTATPPRRAVLVGRQQPTTPLSSTISVTPEHQLINGSRSSGATMVVSVQCETTESLLLDGNDYEVDVEEAEDHFERLEIPRPQSYREMIDAVMERYEYQPGVRLRDANAVWKVTSASGRFTALTGRVDDVVYTTDVFPTDAAPSSPYPCHIALDDDGDSFSPDDLTLSFEVRCPREIRHGQCSGVVGGTLFFVRAMAGAPIAVAFLTAQMAALRDHNPESPLAEQIAALLSSPRILKTIRKKNRQVAAAAEAAASGANTPSSTMQQQH
jgi:hypothetical protein